MCTWDSLQDKAQPENVTAKVMRRMALAEFEFSSKPFADQEPSPEIQDLLEKMFQRDPVQRIKAQQILEHPWLQGAHVIITCHACLEQKTFMGLLGLAR